MAGGAAELLRTSCVRMGTSIQQEGRLGCGRMKGAAKEKAREEARKAQAAYDAAESKFQDQIAKARKARREKFKKAQDAGLTHREIAEAAGLHHTRVGAILRED